MTILPLAHISASSIKLNILVFCWSLFPRASAAPDREAKLPIKANLSLLCRCWLLLWPCSSLTAREVHPVHLENVPYKCKDSMIFWFSCITSFSKECEKYFACLFVRDKRWRRRQSMSNQNYATDSDCISQETKTIQNIPTGCLDKPP